MAHTHPNCRFDRSVNRSHHGEQNVDVNSQFQLPDVPDLIPLSSHLCPPRFHGTTPLFRNHDQSSNLRSVVDGPVRHCFNCIHELQPESELNRFLPALQVVHDSMSRHLQVLCIETINSSQDSNVPWCPSHRIIPIHSERRPV